MELEYLVLTWVECEAEDMKGGGVFDRTSFPFPSEGLRTNVERMRILDHQCFGNRSAPAFHGRQNVTMAIATLNPAKGRK